MNPPNIDLVLSGISSHVSRPNSDIFGVKFDRKLTFEVHACEWYCVSFLTEYLYFEIGETTLLCYFVAILCICVPYP